MYEKHILGIFLEVGDRGISVALLAKHVYNMNSTLFYQPDFQDVLKKVRNYVVGKSHVAKPLLERTDRWGFYRLTPRGARHARTLLAAEQGDGSTNNEDEKPQRDFSLHLFPDF